MLVKNKLWITILICLFFYQNNIIAQDQSQDTSSPIVNSPRAQLAAIIFAGLGGAVLGLSTLSFYGRPQDNLENVAVGFGAGIILGTIIITYKTATERRNLQKLQNNSVSLIGIDGSKDFKDIFLNQSKNCNNYKLNNSFLFPYLSYRWEF